MKTTVVYAAITGNEQGLNRVIKIIEDTFIELGVDIETINLSLLDIPYYDGISSNVVANIFKKLEESEGVIFACTASRLAPCAVMQTFLEHMDYEVYSEVLKEKSCFSVITSLDGSEINCEQYLSSLISSLGGTVINRLSIGSDYISRINKNEEIKEMIEKYAEDYYRMLRQNRKFFISHETTINQSAMASSMVKRGASTLNDSEEEMLLGSSNAPKGKKIKAEELLSSLDFTEFNEQQENDINEITKLISESYNNNHLKQKTVSDLYKTNMANETIAPTPHIKTCKQKTQSVIHYFQPQLARDVSCIYQINIKGKEKFECYIEIKNGECEYYDGIADDADVSVYAQSEDWNDILDGKYTTQKGFMTGKLKVRGNFILLSKFDQFFKFNS